MVLKVIPIFLEPGRAHARDVMCDVDTQLSSPPSAGLSPHPLVKEGRVTVQGLSKVQGREPHMPCSLSQQISVQKRQICPLCWLLPSSESLVRANATLDGSMTLELFPRLNAFQVAALGYSSFDFFFAGHQDQNQRGKKVPCAGVWDIVSSSMNQCQLQARNSLLALMRNPSYPLFLVRKFCLKFL